MIRQYRHPVGLRSCGRSRPGCATSRARPLVETARRELLEETGYRAGEWHVLVDSYTSPGFTTERIRIFLARGLEQAAETPATSGSDEEKYLRTEWVPLAEAVRLALAGKLHNGAAITGVLAGYIASSAGFLRASPGRRPRRLVASRKNLSPSVNLTVRMGTLRTRRGFLGLAPAAAGRPGAGSVNS